MGQALFLDTFLIASMLNQYSKNQTAGNNPVTPIRTEQFDPTLYLVINPEQCFNNNVAQTALSSVEGGVTAIQLRSKSMGVQEIVDMVADVVDALDSKNIPVFVNDHVHIAASTGVNAVHLGQDDMAVEEARMALGDDAYLGLTVRSVCEARNAPLQLLNYVSVGGVFHTRSKIKSDPPIGLNGLKEIVSLLRSRDPHIPIIAISGITTQNLESILECGVDGVAVVSAICESENPRLVAQQFKTRINEFRNRMRI